MARSLQYIFAVSVLLALCGIARPACAQRRDSIIQEFKVKAKHHRSNDTRINDFSPGQKITVIDSALLSRYQLQSMASLLTQQLPVFVKSYGFNGLATLNFRGSSAAQSAVLWNGIPIQNAALGIADVSALPVSFISKASVVYGGSSALWGSGNVGGALVLENDRPTFGKRHYALAAQVGAGSFGQLLGGLNGRISGERWYLSGNVFAQQAHNDFTYTTEAGNKEIMPNSRLQSAAIILNGAYKTGRLSVLNLYGWYQQYDRQIPPALPEAYSVKQQQDGSLRLLAEWTRQGIKNRWYARSALIRDAVDYRDSAIMLHTSNAVYQYYQEVGWRRDIGRVGKLLLFIPAQLAWLNNTGVAGHAQQAKAALAGAFSTTQLHNRLNAAVNVRAETILSINDSTSRQNILLPGADAAYAITPWLSVRANVQRTFRVPTLNELFYFPGGNATLKPERGWSEDAGYTVNLSYGKLSLYHDLSVFNRDIHDWILWVGGAIWTPHNIAEVHSRGIETENSLTYGRGNWKAHLGINTAYVLATTVVSYIYNDGSTGKQIPYTPRYNGQMNVGLSYKGLSVYYNHTYTGYRFTTADESYYLLPYQTGNVQLSLSGQYLHREVQLSAVCNNIWNTPYHVVALRPMPGTNWLATLKVALTAPH